MKRNCIRLIFSLNFILLLLYFDSDCSQHFTKQIFWKTRTKRSLHQKNKYEYIIKSTVKRQSFLNTSTNLMLQIFHDPRLTVSEKWDLLEQLNMTNIVEVLNQEVKGQKEMKVEYYNPFRLHNTQHLGKQYLPIENIDEKDEQIRMSNTKPILISFGFLSGAIALITALSGLRKKPHTRSRLPRTPADTTNTTTRRHTPRGESFSPPFPSIPIHLEPNVEYETPPPYEDTGYSTYTALTLDIEDNPPSYDSVVRKQKVEIN